MNAVLDEIRRSPRLPAHVEELTRFLREEEAARRRFLEELDEGTKAEFINGEVILHSPARFRHNRVVVKLSGLLGQHVLRHGLGEVGIEKVMVSLARNDYEPDVVFFGTEKASRIRPDQMRHPAPDFVAEVLSESTSHRDRGVKFDDFAAHGVREYWIVDPDAETLEQYVLVGESYERVAASADGVVRSVAVPGFEIPAGALFDVAQYNAAMARIVTRIASYENEPPRPDESAETREKES